MSQGIDISDFSGGLNTRDGAGGIADNEIAESQNCYLVKRGYAKRKGYSRYTGTSRIDGAEAGYHVSYAPFVSAAKTIGVTGSKVAYVTGGAWSDITASVSLTGTRPAVSTMINDNFVACNGTDPAWYWSGSGDAATLSGDNIPTSPTTCEQFSGRLFLADERTLYWSGWMGEWTKFNAKDYQPFSSVINGLKVIGDSQQSVLTIFCDRGVHICQFTPSVEQAIGGRGAFTFDTLSDSSGCAAPASVQEVYVPNLGYAIVWADYDGLKIYNPAIGIDKMTDKIRDDWDALDLSQIANFTGTFYRNKGWYILNCRSTSGSMNDKQIIIDLNNSNPSAADPDKRWIISGVFNWESSVFGTTRESGVEILLGCDGDGYWNRYDYTQNDNGTAIVGYFKTKSFDAGLPHYRKGLQSLGLHYTYFGKYTLDITAYYDHLGERYNVEHTTTAGVTLGSFVLDQDILGETEQLVVTNQEMRGWGRTIQLEIRNEEEGQPFRIHKLQPQFRVGRQSILS